MDKSSPDTEPSRVLNTQYLKFSQVVRVFEPQLRYRVYFPTNNLGIEIKLQITQTVLLLALIWQPMMVETPWKKDTKPNTDSKWL